MSLALDDFLAAMNGSFEQWHDGLGYPLELLPRLNAGEKEQLTRLLRQRLAGGGSWRDAEALAFLAGEGELLAWLEHPQAEVRRYAWRRTQGVPEEEVLVGIAEVQAMESLDETIQLAAENNSAHVRRALLRQVQEHEDPVVRVHLAALLWHLCGMAEDVFDWQQREWFLQFGEADRAAAEMRLKKAVEEKES